MFRVIHNMSIEDDAIIAMRAQIFNTDWTD